MTRQTVPNTGSSDRKRLVADSRQPCTFATGPKSRSVGFISITAVNLAMYFCLRDVCRMLGLDLVPRVGWEPVNVKTLSPVDLFLLHHRSSASTSATVVS